MNTRFSANIGSAAHGPQAAGFDAQWQPAALRYVVKVEMVHAPVCAIAVQDP